MGSFRNAIVTLAAIGGSTNAVVHLLAIAGRLGVPLTLADFDRFGTRRAAAGGPAASWQVPDGRPATGPAGSRPCCDEIADLLDPDAAHRDGQAAGRVRRRRGDLGPGRDPQPRDPAPAERRDRRSVRQPRARPARSSSPPRRRRTCCGTGAGRSCSTRSRTCTRVSTPPTSMLTPTACWSCAAAVRSGYPGMPEVANLPLAD